MKISRRTLLATAGAAPLASALAATSARTTSPRASHTPITTLNGRSLPFAMKDGVKEFHLIAEEIEHEFAPGTKIKAWGYNGSTPGPTIEAVEGDRVRILLTNKLPEHTTIHWHGVLLPNGMDGIGGLTQPHIQPGETWAYEFTLREHGTHMYHPHADEVVQLASGMMGLFIIHPRDAANHPVDRDFAFLLHNWALRPGTHRPDPSVMTDFDLWTFNSKVFPAIEPLVVQRGQRVRIRVGNLSMHEHPVHLHGYRLDVTGGDGGRWSRSAWRTEVTEIVGVGQMRDIEFTADEPGDWALHCHKSHHNMNAMGHGIPNPVGVDTSRIDDRLRTMLPGYLSMGRNGMAEHAEHTAMGHAPGPANTLPMMGGQGPYGNMEMGGMFTIVKVRDHLHDGHADPGWYSHPPGTQARRVDPPGAAPAPMPEEHDHDHLHPDG
jgi:manganese oxidase